MEAKEDDASAIRATNRAATIHGSLAGLCAAGIIGLSGSDCQRTWAIWAAGLCFAIGLPSNAFLFVFYLRVTNFLGFDSLKKIPYSASGLSG